MSFTHDEREALQACIMDAWNGRLIDRERRCYLETLVARETTAGEDLTLSARDLATHILSPVTGRPLSLAELRPLAAQYLQCDACQKRNGPRETPPPPPPEKIAQLVSFGMDFEHLYPIVKADVEMMRDGTATRSSRMQAAHRLRLAGIDRADGAPQQEIRDAELGVFVK